MEILKKHWLIVVLVVFVLSGGWVYQQMQQEKEALSKELTYAKLQVQDLTELVAKKEVQEEAHKELIRIFRQQSSAATQDFSQMRNLVAQATQTIEDIKKLEEADEELLAKYSKVYFLNEHYVPDALSYIPSEFVLSDKNLQIKAEVQPFLVDMLQAMIADELTPRVVSAYRSFGYQEQLKERHTVQYGTSVSNQFVADQGYSEHQLGTTVDIVNTKIGSNMDRFDTTDEYTWLLAHAHEYGFILSYPEDNAYYSFEPWHWRFVGIELATRLYESNETFYTLPQRELHTYRVKMFEQ